MCPRFKVFHVPPELGSCHPHPEFSFGGVEGAGCILKNDGSRTVLRMEGEEGNQT